MASSSSWRRSVKKLYRRFFTAKSPETLPSSLPTLNRLETRRQGSSVSAVCRNDTRRRLDTPCIVTGETLVTADLIDISLIWAGSSLVPSLGGGNQKLINLYYLGCQLNCMYLGNSRITSSTINLPYYPELLPRSDDSEQSQRSFRVERSSTWTTYWFPSQMINM